MAIKDVILCYAKGEKGDPGPRGEKGNTGATGPKGDPGNIADAQITDTEGLDVAKGQKTTAQKLFDAIANRIVTKLVTNDALTKKLADYMLKGMMSNTNVNNTGTVPTSALMYSMFEQINNNLGNTVKYLRTDNIDNAAETLWPKIEESSSYDFTWIPETGEGVTKGAQARVIGFYNNSNYESQMILSYLTSAPVVQREKINGSWGNWKVFATKSDLTNNLNHKKQILPWGNYRDGSYSISNFKFGSNLYIAVGSSSRVQKRCSIIAANDLILIPHPEGFVTIVFNDANHITVSGTTDNYQLREIRASDLFGI